MATWWNLDSIAKKFTIEPKELVDKLFLLEITDKDGIPTNKSKQTLSLHTKKGKWLWNFNKISTAIAPWFKTVNSTLATDKQSRDTQRQLMHFLSLVGINLTEDQVKIHPPKDKVAITLLAKNMDFTDHIQAINKTTNNQIHYLVLQFHEMFERKQSEFRFSSILLEKLKKRRITPDDFGILCVDKMLNGEYAVSIAIVDEIFVFDISEDTISQSVSEIYDTWDTKTKNEIYKKTKNPLTLRKKYTADTFLWIKLVSLDDLCIELEQHVVDSGYITLHCSTVEYEFLVDRIQDKIVYNEEPIVGKLDFKQTIKQQPLEMILILETETPKTRIIYHTIYKGGGFVELAQVNSKYFDDYNNN